jgi:hypothetical protein
MDKTTLVEGQINDGQKLIDRLAENGIAVTAAGWLKESEAGLWCLYLATPVVSNDEGPRPAYRSINAVIRALPEPLGFSPFQIKAVSSSGPIAEALRDFQRRHPAKYALPFGSGGVGGVSVDAGYIYPRPAVTTAP